MFKWLASMIDKNRITASDFGVHVFGHNTDVDAAETIWGAGGLFPWAEVGTNETTAIVSASANDTANGTGARTLEVEGLVNVVIHNRSGYQIKRETVTMNGLTPVVCSNFFAFVYHMHTQTVGSGGKNAADIIATHGADTIALMETGENVSEDAVMIVPQFTAEGAYIQGAYITDVHARNETVSTATTDIALMFSENSNNIFYSRYRGAINADSAMEHSFDVRERVPPGSRVELRATSVSAVNQNISGGFSMVYEIG